jgi:protein-tyrosine phosphatase
MPAPGRAPRDSEARKIHELLARGELVLLPTETVYGIAARADLPGALGRLARLKARPAETPLSRHVGVPKGSDPIDALPDALDFPGITRRLVSDFWPGPLTLVLRTEDPALAPITRDGRVGLRAPSHVFTSALLKDLDFPVVLSSANLHGEPPATEVGVALAGLGGAADDLALVVDAGPTASAQAQRASSVLVLEPGRFELTREGLLSLPDLQRTAGLSIAFACTGNTCRSPMAEALGRRALSLLLGTDAADFGFAFSSMGLAAYPGSPPSAHAVEVMRSRDLDIGTHRSSSLTGEALLGLDRIYTMTRAHRDGLLGALEDISRRTEVELPEVELLDADGRNISDPFGGSLEDYERAARDIEAGIAARISDWV